MTREEAIKALSEGKTLTHPYFTSGEWVREENGTYIFEDGVTCPKNEFWWIRDGAHWNDHWTIFKNKPNKNQS